MQKTPIERDELMTLSPVDYDRQAIMLDRNFSVVSRDPQQVMLRLDFPGKGISAIPNPEFLRAAERYFKSIGLA